MGCSPATFLLLAAIVEPVGAARLEARVGEAPLVAGAPPQASVALAADGTIGLWLLAPRLLLRIAYQPRVLWRQPNLLDELRPLLLHQGSLSADLELSRRTRLHGDAGVSYGQPDYIGLRAILGQDQRALPVVTRLLGASANLALRSRVTRTWELVLPLQAAHLDPLDQQAPDEMTPGGPPAPLLPRQSSLGFRPQTIHRLSTRSEATGELGIWYQTMSLGLTVLAVTPQIGLAHHMSETRTASGAIGFTHAILLERPVDTGSAQALTPVGQLNFSGELWRAGRRRLTATGGVQVSWFLDPVTATAGPLGGVNGGLHLHLSERTRLEFGARAATSLLSRPRPGGFNETMVSAQATWAHRVTRSLSAVAGVLWVDQAPHLMVPGFRFNQRELWGHAALEFRPPEPSARR